MGVRERKIEKYLDMLVTGKGGITRKWISPGHDGVPDRIVIMPMKVKDVIERLSKMHPDEIVADFHLVEVKTNDGKLSAVQARECQRLLDVGAKTAIVYGETGVECWVRERLK